MTGCGSSTQSSQIKQTIDPCKDVPKYVWGVKGKPLAEINSLVQCYDWEIKVR